MIEAVFTQWVINSSICCILFVMIKKSDIDDDKLDINAKMKKHICISSSKSRVVMRCFRQ